MSDILDTEPTPALPGQLSFSWEDASSPGNDSQATTPGPKPTKSSMKKSSKKKAKPAAKSSGKATGKSAAKKSKKTKTATTAKKAAPKKNAAAPAKKKPSKPAKKKKSEKKPAAKTAKPTVSLPEKNFADSVDSFDLKWGARMPAMGFGFWKVDQDKTAEVCDQAIRVGYRHLDCACDYGNEVQVGEGIAKALGDGVCEREDLWVTSKLWNTYHDPNHVRQACEKSLNDLGLDYLDLYLIHFPIAQRFVPFEKRYPPGWFFDPNAAEPTIEEERIPIAETWRAMEELAKSGLVRNIGISNFGTSQIRDLLATAKIRPAILQVESHPYLTQEKLLRFCERERIVYTAFSPLGAESYYSIDMAKPDESVLRHKTVAKIAAEVGKTEAQVLLRWGVQRGTAVIPKTSKVSRMVENIDIFDFSLTDKQMKAISALNQDRRFNDPGDFGEAAFNTFLPIYE